MLHMYSGRKKLLKVKFNIHVYTIYVPYHVHIVGRWYLSVKMFKSGWTEINGMLLPYIAKEARGVRELWFVHGLCTAACLMKPRWKRKRYGLTSMQTNTLFFKYVFCNMINFFQESLDYFGDRRTDLTVGKTFQGVETPSQVLVLLFLFSNTQFTSILVF